MDFKKVELKDKNLIETYCFNNDGLNLSSYNFSNMFIYRNVLKYIWAEFEDILIIYLEKYNIFYFPISKDAKLLDFNKFTYVDSVLKKYFKDFKYILVPEVFVNAYKDKLENDFSLKLNPDHFDYIYKTEKLAQIKGRKYHKKRNLISQFKRLYPDYKVSKLEVNDFDDCYKLSQIWCEIRSCLEMDFTHEISALLESLKYFNDLNFEGMKIKNNDELFAFSIFTKLNKNMVINNFEKYNPNVKGSSQMINYVTANYLSDKYTYINREQDLGIEGLRKAKKSYYKEENMGIVYELF